MLPNINVAIETRFIVINNWILNHQGVTNNFTSIRFLKLVILHQYLQVFCFGMHPFDTGTVPRTETHQKLFESILRKRRDGELTLQPKAFNTNDVWQVQIYLCVYMINSFPGKFR